jgi:aldehyde decarbonylase
MAVVLNSIPHDAKQVFLHAAPSKIAYATAFALCEKGVKVC